MTDGEISDTFETINLVKQYSDRCRVFSIGIGYSFSHHLVNGLARAGNGMAEYISPGEPSSSKMLRQVERVSKYLKIEKINWMRGSHILSPVFASPENLPYLYKNSRIILYSLFDSKQSKEPLDFDTVEILLNNGNKFSISKENIRRKINGNIIATLTARSRIRDLEEKLLEDNNDQSAKKDIKEIATKYNLMSSETSMIGVDRSFIHDTKNSYTINIPILRERSSGSSDCLLLDISPLSQGFEVAGGLMNVIIPRNSMVPKKKSSIISTEQDNQDKVIINIYEGERVLVKDNHFLGKLELTGITPSPKGVPQIEVIFEIDVNGVSSVTAREKVIMTTHKEILPQETFINSQTITITAEKYRLSPEEIERMILEAERLVHEDEVIHNVILAKK